MAVMSRLLPMLAFSTFALFLLALLATPTNAFESNHAHSHSGLAMRKRSAAKLAKSKKLLMAWPGGTTDIDKWKGGSNIAGFYSWSIYDPTKGMYSFFPMLWGPKQANSFAKMDASKYSLCFGPNEPNHEAQANMSPGDAARLWRDKMEPARSKGCKLVSPAVTSAPSGKTWLQDFFKACKGCNIDFVAVHWYGTKPEQLKAYVTDFSKAFNKPIVVSEYACQDFAGGPQCTNDQTVAFHKEMAQWFHQNPNVAMYGPFGFMKNMVDVNPYNRLMNLDGSPNKLGKAYITNDWSGVY
ncbi:hypothetical protein FRC07_006811 [Ceratobasidium sp. 392]|nr:hypothetical protein FRC07_006811 [Ceratobasidium sp. 392]